MSKSKAFTNERKIYGAINFKEGVRTIVLTTECKYMAPYISIETRAREGEKEWIELEMVVFGRDSELKMMAERGIWWWTKRKNERGIWWATERMNGRMNCWRPEEKKECMSESWQ